MIASVAGVDGGADQVKVEVTRHTSPSGYEGGIEGMGCAWEVKVRQRRVIVCKSTNA